MPVSRYEFDRRQTFDAKIAELQAKINAIKDLKTKIQSNISDENDAQRMYNDQLRLAQKVGKTSVEYILKDVAMQESRHAEVFRRAINELDQEISKLTTQVEQERRKKDEEQRQIAEKQRREEEAQRNSNAQNWDKVRRYRR